MPTNPGRARRWLGIALAALLCLPLATALAQESGDLVAGAPAAVSSSGGEAALLRAQPSFEAAVLVPLGAGETVQVVGGPITDPTGTAWYRVAAGDQTGFVPAGSLGAAAAPAAEPESAAEAEATVPPPAAPEPTAAPDPTAEVVTATAVTAAPSETPPPPTPVVDGEAAGETAVATDAVNLRAEPNAAAPVLLVVPAGAVVGRAGDARDGFAEVSYGGVTGWAALAFLTLGAGRPEEIASTPVPADATAVPADAPDGAATATALLNLRGGPSYDDAVLRVLPPGAPLTVTGAATAGFLPVLYNGTEGWVDAAYLATGEAAPETAAPAPADGAAPLAFGPATTTGAVNLRAGPSGGAPVSVVVPSGATLETTGPAQDGFVPVSFADRTGWVAEEFLSFEGASTATVAASPVADASPTAAPAATSEGTAEGTPAAGTAPTAAGGSGLIWPVSGGAWEIMQGYNGSSHQNQDGLWQYYYSLDLVREDGATAGQTVVSPASGTVRWTDPSSGGISIDIGGGHAVALYHVAVDPSIAWGDPVAQGEAIGTVSGPGGPGFAGTPHVHFALWETTDGGNWSRSAAPFVGPYAIAGQEFPDTGGGNQHRGTAFTP